MGKHTRNRLALKWLWEVLPPGYTINLLGRNSIRIERDPPTGDTPVLTTDSPAELEAFMRDFFSKTIPARVLPFFDVIPSGAPSIERRP